jgi:diaminopimelate epimerase
MKIPYWRYSATGNTFLIFDNREGKLHEFSAKTYESWAFTEKVDGLLFLELPREKDSDFHMRYLNADGGEVEMCGNGARSITHFAQNICGIKPKAKEYIFSTLCSIYKGSGSHSEGYPISMTEVGPFDSKNIEGLYSGAQSSFYLFTGVPHCCFEVKDLEAVDLLNKGREIRFNPLFEKGTNVNFFSISSVGKIRMRTYERGVEGETDSCGTGATAVALCVARNLSWGSPVTVEVPGGTLNIGFDSEYRNATLSGAVELLGDSLFELPKA